MPGFELINYKEKRAASKIFDEGGVLFAHGFEKKRKKFHVRELEKKFSILLKSRYVLAVSSGTAAIKIALKALGVKKGDEVITQSFNFIATIEAILDCGAKPIIVNVDETLNMCPIDLIKKITKKTKVIIPVHMLGVSCNLKAIKQIAKKKNIKILEDNCESLMGKYNKSFLGTCGEIGVLSLDYGKFITAGEGGIILTNNKKLYLYCKQYHDHGHENNPKYSRGNDTKTIFGFNYRMTEIQAAICKEQLKKANYLLKENFIRYNVLEKNIYKNIKRRLVPTNSKPNYDTFIFFVNEKSKKKIIKYLNKIKLGTKNLPDAIKWHCSYFWDHALSEKQINHSKKTLKLLEKAIAVPIFVKKKTNLYYKLAKKINEIVKKNV